MSRRAAISTSGLRDAMLVPMRALQGACGARRCSNSSVEMRLAFSEVVLEVVDVVDVVIDDVRSGDVASDLTSVPVRVRLGGMLVGFWVVYGAHYQQG